MEKGGMVELFARVKKAADAALHDGGEEQRCLESLKRLKEFPVTNDVLAAVHVKNRLGPLSRHPRKRIQAAVSEVIHTWDAVLVKKQVHSCRISGLSMKNKKAYNVVIKKVEQQPSSRCSSDSLKQQAAASLLGAVDGNRQKIRQILGKGLSVVADEVGDDEDLRARIRDRDPWIVAHQVETEMFNKWGAFASCSQTFKAKYRAITSNLMDPKNPDFRRKVLLGQLPPLNVVELTSEDMASEAMQLEISRIRAKKLMQSLCDRTVATTDLFRCGKCHQNQCVYYEMQTRRADEPMTAFITCVNCNNHWRQ